MISFTDPGRADQHHVLVALDKAQTGQFVDLTLLDTGGESEVTSKQIGELVMEKLKPMDEVAYVRFASVYRQFKDIDSFKRELDKILEER